MLYYDIIRMEYYLLLMFTNTQIIVDITAFAPNTTYC